MLQMTSEIVGGDYAAGGAASRSVKEHLKRIGVDPAVIRRAAIAAYEAEMNVVIHASRGTLRATVEDGHLHVEIRDEGPGIADIELALQEGYSTASAQARELGFGAGLGLPNIRKNSDSFRLESTVGRGTAVYFSLSLRPQSLYGLARHSLVVEPDRCLQSYRCLHACPTHAVRLRRGRPEVLDYLCVDCTACIAACAQEVWGVRDLADLPDPGEAGLLILDPPALLQFGPRHRPVDALAALTAVGFERVVVTEPWSQALRVACSADARAGRMEWPVLSPMCPAVVNLITLRFPSLLAHVPGYASPMEAIAATFESERFTVVVSCPGQRSSFRSEWSSFPDHGRATCVPPRALCRLVAGQLQQGSRAAAREKGPVPQPPVSTSPEPLDRVRVTGERAVVRALEETESGLLGDVAVLELWMCPEGCFGSPHYKLHPALARYRWEAYSADVSVEPAARAVPRRTQLTPRKGLRLDEDMPRAIRKLARMDEITRSLPGSNCGLCGAPTCAALAEDIALGRADPDACVRPSLVKETC